MQPWPDISKESICRMVNGKLYSSGNYCIRAQWTPWEPLTHRTRPARDCFAFSPEGELRHFDTLAEAKAAIKGEENSNIAALLYSINSTIDAKRKRYGWYIFCASEQVRKFENIKPWRAVRKTKVPAWNYGLEQCLRLNLINILDIRPSRLLPICNVAIFNNLTRLKTAQYLATR